MPNILRGTFSTTVEPQWQLDLSADMQQLTVNEEWIAQGTVTDDRDTEDPCPWLRAVQREGLELVIVGSTVEAVRTCNEAYQAGFMTVLILLSDLAIDTDEVEEELVRLESHSWIRQPFKVGPCLISSSRDKCVVNFDSDGNPLDVYVRTNVFGIHSASEAWQYFKGPVLVIDPAGAGDEFGRSDANGHRNSLSIAMEQEAEDRMGWRHQAALQQNLQEKAEVDQEREAQSSSRSADSKLPREEEDQEPFVQGFDSESILRLKAAQARKRAYAKKMLANEAAKEAEVVVASVPKTDSADPDDETTHDRMDGPAMRYEAGRRYYAERLPQIREALIDCNFWKERYDPDRLGYILGSYRKMFLCGAYYFLGALLLALEGLDGVLHSGWFITVRLILNAVFVAPVCIFLAVALGGSLGFIARLKPNRMNMKVGIITSVVVICLLSISIDTYHFTFPACAIGGLATTWIVGVLTARYWEKKHVSYWNLKWSLVLSAVVLLSILLPLMVVSGYLLAIMHLDGSFPSFFLMPMFMVTEMVLTTSIVNSYEYLVWSSRQRQTNSALGDQRSGLSIALMVILGASEAGRTTALLAGALCQVRLTYLADSCMAIVVGLIQNVLHRSGWMTCLMASAMPHHLYWWCPTSTFAFCQDCKLVLWWAPFFFPVGLALGRGVISWNWSIPPLESTDQSVWCWNQMICMVFAFALVAKVLEDVAVMFFITHCRAPVWDVFGEHMTAQVSGTSGTSDVGHNFHLFVLDKCETDVSAAGLAARAYRPTLTPWSRRNSVHIEQPDIKHNAEMRIISAPTLRHCQEARVTQMLVITCIQYLVFCCAITIAVGVGNVHTRCPVLRLDSMRTLLLRLVLITTDPARECDPFPVSE